MSNSHQNNSTVVERRFDVIKDINEEWFRSYAGELAKYAKDAEDVRCEVWLGHNSSDRRIIFRNRQAWLDFVITNWTDIAETTIRQYGGLVEFASCNHRLHHVLLNIEADSIQAIEKLFQMLSQNLSLAISPKDPFKYRRSSIEFEIGHWKPNSFILGIQRIAVLLGPDPYVEEAYAKSFEGDIEKLTPFFDRKSFCDAVGKLASRFGEIVFRMRARSVTVGIAVPSDHKKLRIRTSLPPDEVDKLIAAWPEDLRLKPTKATDTGANVSGAVPAATENPWLKYGVPVIVAFVTAVSITSIVSLKKAVWPDYKVTITSPHVENGLAKWWGNDVIVDWYLQPEQASLRAIRKDAVGTVRVHGFSGVHREIVSKPPVSIKLPLGSYIILVDAPDVNPAQVQVEVAKPVLRPSQPDTK